MESDSATTTSKKIAFQWRQGGFEALLFSLRAAIAGVIALYAYEYLTGLPGAAWAAVSAVIVLDPQLRVSLRVGIIRCAANLAGALAGTLGALCFANPVEAMVIALLATGLICHYTHLDDGRRSAFAAVVILVMSESTYGNQNRWLTFEERFLAVLTGCAVSFLVSLAFTWTLKKKKI